MNLISENIAGGNPLYNLSYVKDLQDKIDAKVAESVNKLLASKKNDLALCFNEEGVQKLSIYYNILEQIGYCNACFADMEVESIISLVYNQINSIK